MKTVISQLFIGYNYVNRLYSKICKISGLNNIDVRSNTIFGVKKWPNNV